MPIAIETISEVYNRLSNDNLSFVYQGYFSDEITDLVIDLSESYISGSKISKLRKKISFLMVECFQNIIRHGDIEAHTLEEKLANGFFTTRNINDIQFITSANVIENANVRSLRDKLQQVNNLEKDELKQLYFLVLDKQQMSSKGGAGLGLIEMARKSGQKLDFDFVPVNENFSNFYLQLKINKSEDEEVTFQVPITDAEEMHRFICDKNILIINKGNFNTEAITPIMTVVEQNLRKAENNRKQQKAAFIVLVEVLQNISKHAYTIDGIKNAIFLMGEEGEKLNLSTGNLIHNADIDKLSRIIDTINFKSRDELHKMYKNMLLDIYDENLGHSMGFVNIARGCSEPILYGFRKITNDYSLFMLSLTI